MNNIEPVEISPGNVGCRRAGVGRNEELMARDEKEMKEKLFGR